MINKTAIYDVYLFEITLKFGEKTEVRRVQAHNSFEALEIVSKQFRELADYTKIERVP